MRSNTLDAARRSYGALVRGTVHASDDKPMMQTVDARLMHGELLTGIERFQPPYGLYSVPIPPDPPRPNAAEVIVGFLGGNRAHPIVLAVDDRRYRPKDWKPGNSGLYHYKGATARFTDDGWVQDAGPDKKPKTFTVGNATLIIADGKVTVQVGGANGPALVVKTDAVYAGGDPDKGGSFARVMTEQGPSDLLKAKVG